MSDAIVFGPVDFYPEGHPIDRWVGKRVKQLKISQELLIDFLRTPTPPGIAQEVIPEDARIVYAYWDWQDQIWISLYLESASFEPVAEDRIVPELVAYYRKGPVLRK